MRRARPASRKMFQREGHRIIRSMPWALLVLGFACAAVRSQVVAPTPIPTPNDPMPVQRTFQAADPPAIAATRVGVISGTDLSITLQRAIEMALGNNNDLRVSRQEIRIAEFSLRGSRGVYDPLINSQGYYESRTTPVASTIGGAVNGRVTQRQVFGDIGLSGFVPRFGGSYDAVFTSARTDSTNRNATLNPQFPTSLTFTYIQPLLRGRRIDQNRRSIAVAAKNVELSETQLRLRTIGVVAAVESAYWNLVFALRNLQVQDETLKQAREQLESNKRLVEKGVLAPIEIVAANAQIATFEQTVSLAQETVTRAENILKTVILADRRSPEWSRPIIPVTPVENDVPQIGLEMAVSAALKDRPELDQLAKTADINRIDQRFYRDQAKPQIDFVGSYATSGLAGTPNPLSSGAATVPENLKGGYATSLGNLLQQDFPTYRAGIQIGLPLGNRTAKANLGRSLVEAERIETLRTQTEQAIEAEVRNALQALRSADARVAAAAAARAASEELFESEQRLFRAGTTTFYLVLQRQTELSAARGRELQARTDLAIAISEFNRAVGSTLRIRDVSVLK